MEKSELENKYYVPEISEFRVGFQYEERYNKNPWEKKVYKIESFINIWSDFTDTEIPDHGDLRVKCLSKEDIESLGFILQPGEYTVHGGITGKYVKDKDYIYVSWRSHAKDGSYPLISIYKLINNLEFRVMHGAKIKNISELKILLKQVGIDG